MEMREESSYPTHLLDIINLLKDSDYTSSELGDKIGIKRSTIHPKCKKLWRDKHIIKYRKSINNIGRPHIFWHLMTDEERELSKEELEKKIGGIVETSFKQERLSRKDILIILEDGDYSYQELINELQYKPSHTTLKRVCLQLWNNGEVIKYRIPNGTGLGKIIIHKQSEDERELPIRKLEWKIGHPLQSDSRSNEYYEREIINLLIKGDLTRNEVREGLLTIKPSYKILLNRLNNLVDRGMVLAYRVGKHPFTWHKMSGKEQKMTKKELSEIIGHKIVRYKNI